MLPPWMNDIGTLVTIITGAPIIFGWFIKRCVGQEIDPPPPTLHPPRRHPVTLWGSLKKGIFHIVIRPEIPIWHDALQVVLATTILMGVSVFYLWDSRRPIELQLDPPLCQLVFLAILGCGVIVTLLWAGLFLKMEYLKRVQ